ncbi:MAG: alpha/beta fold hydrolase [Acidobacteria bacterium]|nr:alpha/beta fold hydrolase [Acidobacteriota bacterium]
MTEPFSEASCDPQLRGLLDRPNSPCRDGLVLTHGAGGNARSALLVSLGKAFSAAGYVVLRLDLPFRQLRAYGPPRPSDASRDRQGLKNALKAMAKIVPGRLFLAGQSYGGRQASMLLAEEALADGLLLLSYPLHAPSHPDRPRTEHLPRLQVPAIFVHGTRDPFGSIPEIEAARQLIPATTELLAVEGVGHDLGFKGKARREDLPAAVVKTFLNVFAGTRFSARTARQPDSPTV